MALARAFFTLLIAAGGVGCLQVGPSGDVERPRAPQAPPMAAMPPPGQMAAGYAPAPAANGGWLTAANAPQPAYNGPAEGVAAGLSYIEMVTGGARADEQLPMIVALHPRGGRIETFERMFWSFPARARVIIPHGYANGRGGYIWWNPRASDAPESISYAVRPTANQVAAALVELRQRRPTIGRPVVCGFSQGAMLSFSMAALYPDLVSAAFPMAGFLPAGFGTPPGSMPRPYVHAFHGAHDGSIPLDRARASIDDLRRRGYVAEITEYPELGHRLGDDEVRTAMAQMAAFVSRPGGP